ncbi:DUF892 family protein [Mucilaginibacter mali]|uniref:DUF892 family protein n=1 Tax=Mucilaginibacter mali TaxID=2740462 RepID=A0A7D4TTG5_9SPHI|nr:DUF892 family protein [Mucilaginibacter mali]QKJ28995.1 DUF892 family protein [Mucilaginibacter mali]
MTQPSKQTLSDDSLRTVFVEQLTILYNAKTNLIENLPRLVEQCTFQNLKSALREDLEDSKTQMATLKEIFKLMAASWETEKCLGVDAMIREALQQVSYKQDNHYESDMSILFYLSAIQNMQVGACKILHLLAKKIAYQPYAQLVLECLDISRDNSKLIQYVAGEYFDIAPDA